METLAIKVCTFCLLPFGLRRRDEVVTQDSECKAACVECAEEAREQEMSAIVELDS